MHGEWRYVYEDPQGKEYETDENGNIIPKHHDWKIGDTVYYNNEPAELLNIGDTIATIKTNDGKEINVQIDKLEHENKRQERLTEQNEKTINKWKELVKKLKADLEAGEKSRVYEYADDKGELQRKIKYAEEELHKREEQAEKIKQERIERNKSIEKTFPPDMPEELRKEILS